MTPHAGAVYVVLGSTSGAAPGTSFGGVSIPLNPDFYTSWVLTHPGSAPLLGGVGTLDSQGTANASFTSAPSSLPPVLLGTNLNHAFVLLDPTQQVVFASNPLLLELQS